MSWKPPDPTTRPVAVIGGGVLGRRLCLQWSGTGKPVILYDSSPKQAQEALVWINEHKESHAKSMNSTPGNMSAVTSLEDAVKDAWMVIEAIPEVLPLKIELFRRLDPITRPDCVLATNSSSYRSSDMIEKVERT